MCSLEPPLGAKRQWSPCPPDQRTQEESRRVEAVHEFYKEAFVLES
jgi:hypothetical protein